jgi:hypothetical protein
VCEQPAQCTVSRVLIAELRRFLNKRHPI